MRRLTRIMVLLLLATPAIARGQAVRDDARVQQALNLLDLWIDAQRDYEHIPGISAGVVYDQDLIWSKGYGYQDRDTRVPPNAATIYSICSISKKLFTSIAVMQLRDQGKLRLDDSVSHHLPWFAIKQAYPDGPPITVEGLLTHASGLPREADWPYWTGPDFTFPTREQVIQQLAKQQTLYPAETYYQYSNLGLTLAGEIVEQVSGQPYAEYVTQHILTPLGLTGTTPEVPAGERGKRLATGYGALSRQGTRTTLPLFQARGIAPAAGFASTVEDLARFAEWQFRLLSRGGTEVLAANTLKEMQRVHFTDTDWRTTWGLGFTVWRNKDKTFVGHGGSCPGYRTQVSLQTDDKIATIFMANALGVSPQPFTMRMYEVLAPALAAAKTTPGGGKQPNPAFAKYYGTYEQSFGGETAVLPWEDGLAMVSFPTNDPVQGLVKLKYLSGDTFRRVREDGQLAEEIVFEANQRGEVTRFKSNSNYSTKVGAR